MSCLAFRIPQYARLHPPKLGFFQYFPATPKPYLTIRIGVVSVWAINLSRIWKWRGWSWGKPQWIVWRIVGITISNSQRLWLGFSFWKHSSTYVGIVGIYSMSRDRVYQIWQNSKIECFVGISLEGLTCETLTKTSCHHPVMTLRIPVMCWAHASLCGKTSH